MRKKTSRLRRKKGWRSRSLVQLENLFRSHVIMLSKRFLSLGGKILGSAEGKAEGSRGTGTHPSLAWKITCGTKLNVVRRSRQLPRNWEGKGEALPYEDAEQCFVTRREFEEPRMEKGYSVRHCLNCCRKQRESCCKRTRRERSKEGDLRTTAGKISIEILS